MVSNGLGPLKTTEPSGPDLTHFLRVKKQKLVCPPITALATDGNGVHNGNSAPNNHGNRNGNGTRNNNGTPNKDNHKNNGTPNKGNHKNNGTPNNNGNRPKNSLHQGNDVAQQPLKTSTPSKAFKLSLFGDKPSIPVLATPLDSADSVTTSITTNPLQHDFLLEGLLTEWRTRREQLFKGAPEVKLSHRSFFPQQHNQIKYWAWPFLGIVALTSSLPLQPFKQVVPSSPQLFHVEIEPETGELQNESEALLFDKLTYIPHQGTSQKTTKFDQTLSLGLATNELNFGKNVVSVIEHPLRNFEYSKMLLDLLVKKIHCHSFKSKPGYVSNLAFTTSESESYFPVHTQAKPSKNVLPSVFKLLRLTEDVKYGRGFMLPYLSSRENWGQPFDPAYYRIFTEKLIYRYLHQRFSIEADLYRQQRKSTQFATRSVDKTLRLEASFKELNLLKQIATSLQSKKKSIKGKPNVKAKAWKSGMDSKQWLDRLVLNAEQLNETILPKPQPVVAKEFPKSVSLFAKDWPTFPPQLTRISKSSLTNTELDTASFLKPLGAAVHPMETVFELANSTVVKETIQDLFPEVQYIGRLTDRLTEVLHNWSFMDSISEGVINDATFLKQFTRTLNPNSSEKFDWARPELKQNTQYQSLAETDSTSRSEFPDQLFRAYLNYKSGTILPDTVPPVSAEFTQMLARSQKPLHFNYTFSSRSKKLRNLSHPTTGALLKTFVFRSPSYLENPYMQDKRSSLKQRRSRRYSRAGIAVKKRKRISPRPRWLRRALYSPLIKLRNPGTSAGSRHVSIKNHSLQRIQAHLNLQNSLTPKYLSSGPTPSLFRQKGLYHSLMRNLPQLAAGKFGRVAKWAEPKSKLRGWRAFLLGNEFAPYTKALNANFKKLKNKHVKPNLTSKLQDMPQWLWKGNSSAIDMENLRFKQGLADLSYFAEAGYSEATMAAFFLNELKLVAAQNEYLYRRLNTMILVHPDKSGFMKDARPDFPGLNRGFLRMRTNYVWPEQWLNVALSPLGWIESQWFAKQVHLLRDPEINDIHSLWQTGKIRKLTTPLRESRQQSIFRLRLPFVSSKQIHPVTVNRSWKKVNVMDSKLNVFGLANHRAQFYPQQLKLRLQKDRGAQPTLNLRLTPQDTEMQRNINHSIRFWWSETEQNLLPLTNPAGTQPWNLFEALVATPQLTSETQPLTVTLVNGSLVLLHIALLSFLIQLPEARTFLKFYALVFNRLAVGYLWATKICYYLMQECVYEIQYAIFCGRTLLFPLVKHHKEFTFPMLRKQLYRVEQPTNVLGLSANRPSRYITRETIKSLGQENVALLFMIDLCLDYSENLQKREEYELTKLNEADEVFPPYAFELLTQDGAFAQLAREQLEAKFLQSSAEKFILDQKLEVNVVKEKTEAKNEDQENEETSLFYAELAQEYYDKFVKRDDFIVRLTPELKRDPWWSYTTEPDLPEPINEVSERLMVAEQSWVNWIYEALYMKERHKAYKAALAAEPLPPPQLPLYQEVLDQRLFMTEAFTFKVYKALAGFTGGIIGFYFLIYRKVYRYYYTIDKGIDTTRRLTLQFLEEPGENAMKVLNDYFFVAFMSDLLTSRPDEAETVQTLFIEFYTRQAHALGPVGSLIQRRLQRLAEDFYIAWTRPDKDLFMRHQKSLIFWNMWGALLIRAVARYKLSLADLLSTKEEQEKLVECLITESDWSWTQQSLIQFQPLFDLFSIGKRSWKDFTASTESKEFGNPPMLETILHAPVQTQELIQQKLTALKTFEQMNPADALYTDSHAATMDELSWRWGAQQVNIYYSRLSTLGVEYQSPTNLAAVPQLKYYTSMHTQLGWVIQDNLRTTFVNTPSKNALIIGPPGPEVTSLVRALVGELELKLITDNARRYTTVIRNVAIGVRHLKEVFYAVSVEAPCLFVLEDIHLIGRRRELLIAEDEELYLLEQQQVTPQTEHYEDDHSIAKFVKHTQLHYEKPFRGDYSFLISTNCFAFDYFKEPAPSRMRRVGAFTKSHYKLRAIEQELIKLRGLENLSNAQSKAPALSLSSLMQARKPVKEVKAAPNSPLTVAIEKNKKAFRPRRIVKNMPLQGISWDMWMLLSRYDYSIRSKVALLAVLTEDAVGELTDMITDLLVMMDTVRATRGLIMFATTHAPTALDPALRRPGRLDETLSVPLFSSLLTRWEILNLRYEGVDRLQELAPYAHITRNLSNSQVSDLALKSLLFALPKQVSLHPSTQKSTTPFQSLQTRMHMSYFEAFFQSRGFELLKDQLNDMCDLPSNQLTLDTQMRQRKFQAKVTTLTYTLVGSQLIRWKAQVVTDQMDADILAYTVEKVHPLLSRLERQFEYLQLDVARLRDSTTVREHITNSLAPRFSETFFTSCLLNGVNTVSSNKDQVDSQVTFQLREKTNYVPLTFEKFELAATRFKPGGDSTFTSFFPTFRNSLVNLGVPASRTSDFISNVIQKRSIWTKNLVVYRLLYVPINKDYREPLGLPMYDLVNPDKNYETLQKEQRVLYRPGNLTMNEKIELHKTYRLYLAVANKTIEEWQGQQHRPEELELLRRHVLPSLEELSSLALVMNHPSGTNKFYRQSTHLRQRFHLIDQWWNGHLEDLDVERALQSEVETRTFFEESIGNDVEIDYPLPDKYYNVRSRRWVWKQNAETWFSKGAKFNDAAAYHYMVCALTRCYEELHKNRESLDHLAYTFLKSGMVSEVKTHSHYTRFYQTDV